MVLLLAPELRCPFLSTGFRHQASATQSDKTCSTRFLPGAEDLGLHVYSMLVEQVFKAKEMQTGTAAVGPCPRIYSDCKNRGSEETKQAAVGPSWWSGASLWNLSARTFIEGTSA